jgi:hypothetical protein
VIAPVICLACRALEKDCDRGAPASAAQRFRWAINCVCGGIPAWHVAELRAAMHEAAGKKRSRYAGLQANDSNDSENEP